MQLKYVILGLLYAKPMHGYGLRQAIAPTLPKSKSLNDGVLYPLIAKLEGAGLIEKQLEPSPDGPGRNVLHITTAGRNEFIEWLESESGEQDEVTYDFFLVDSFLAKAAFLRHLSADQRVEKFDRQTRVAAEKIATLETIRKGMVEAGLSDLHLAIIDLGIEQHRLRVKWLKRLAKQVKSDEFVRTKEGG